MIKSKNAGSMPNTFFLYLKSSWINISTNSFVILDFIIARKFLFVKEMYINKSTPSGIIVAGSALQLILEYLLIVLLLTINLICFHFCTFYCFLLLDVLGTVVRTLEYLFFIIILVSISLLV